MTIILNFFLVRSLLQIIISFSHHLELSFRLLILDRHWGSVPVETAICLWYWKGIVSGNLALYSSPPNPCTCLPLKQGSFRLRRQNSKYIATDPIKARMMPSTDHTAVPTIPLESSGGLYSGSSFIGWSLLLRPLHETNVDDTYEERNSSGNIHFTVKPNSFKIGWIMFISNS